MQSALDQAHHRRRPAAVCSRLRPRHQRIYTTCTVALQLKDIFLSSGLDSYVDSYKDRHFCRHNAFVACELALWYGVVNVDLYSAMITKVTNALNALVSGEEPGFQALSKGLVVLLCAEVVRQTVMLTRPQGSRPRPRPRPRP